MRFRQFVYAVKADMKDMFLKIRIRSEDVDVQRFLWRGEDRSSPPYDCLMKSMFFGANSSPTTAIYIKNKNAKLFLKKYPGSALSMVRNCYMDDFLDSCETWGEAYDRVREVSEINAYADWEMHIWSSNDSSIFGDDSQLSVPKQLVKSDSFE